MPLTESPPDALANIYARSLLELAEAGGGRERIESVLDQLEDILDLARSDRRFGEFLASRVLTADQRRGTLRAIFDGRCDDLVLRFLQVVNHKGRLSHLPAIAAAYDAMAQERFGRVEVDVFTAAPLDMAELDTIRERLGSILSKDVVLHPYTDESMIGGVKFRIGDRLVDASLSSKLRRMRDRFNTTGTAELRARAQGILDRSAD
jgi:F-type H+-transporting ATPase subunit delta